MVRSNAIIVLTDMASRFPNLIEPWTPHLYARLRDDSIMVRRNTVAVLTHLILHDMVKVRSTICEFCARYRFCWFRRTILNLLASFQEDFASSVTCIPAYLKTVEYVQIHLYSWPSRLYDSLLLSLNEDVFSFFSHPWCIVTLLVGLTPLPVDPFLSFLGSGPNGVHDLCFHTGIFYFSYSFVPPFWAHISASRPISKP